jgi:NAD(P)-dependent dehydrogenase (short-subunit alcohol dehydrogenase family)
LEYLRLESQNHNIVVTMFSGKHLQDWQPSPLGDARADGMRVIIVGGTGGLGGAIARWLAARGAEVTVVGQTFRDAGVAGLSFVKADLSLLSEARRIADTLPAEQIDLLIFTTGIFSSPHREITPEGIERDLATSYLNRLVMLRSFAPRLGNQRGAGARPVRVFIMGFPGLGEAGNPDDLNSEQAYRQIPAHMNTVAANEALVIHAARAYPHLRIFGLNPGLVKTNIRSNVFGGSDSLRFKFVEVMIGLFTPTPEQYAERLGPAILAPELDDKSGIHFNAKGTAIAPSPVMTVEHVHRLIAASEDLLPKK